MVAAGADDGTSCANAKSFGWATNISNYGSGAGKISAGDTVHLCGRFTNAIWIRGSGSPGNRTTWKAESGMDVVMSRGVEGSCIYTDTNNFLTIDGNGTGRCEFTNNGTGLTYSLSSFPIASTPTLGDVEIKGWFVTNGYIHLTSDTRTEEAGSGIVMTVSGSTNCSIHNNHVSMCQLGVRFVASTATGRNSGLSQYSNTLDRCSHGFGGGTGGDNCHIDGLYVYNNNIDNAGVWQQANNYFHLNGGYYYSEASIVNAYISNVFIFNNQIGPMTNVTDNTTANIYLSASVDNDARIVNVFAFNNVLFGNIFSNGRLVWLNVWHSWTFNNTINNPDAGNGLSFYVGTNHVFWDNIVSGAQTSFYGNGLPFQDWGLEFKFNNYSQNGGYWGDNGGPFNHWTNWTAVAPGYNYDQGSNTNDCQYVNEAGFNFHIPSGTNTAASGTGTNLTAWINGQSATYPFLTNALRDIEGHLRPTSAPWSMGAYEPNYVADASAPPAITLSGRQTLTGRQTLSR